MNGVRMIGSYVSPCVRKVLDLFPDDSARRAPLTSDTYGTKIPRRSLMRM